MQARHTEFFGPDFARGPYASHQMPSAALQIATALAQLRAPLTRADEDIQSHADFIAALADRLAPDYASQIVINVGALDPSLYITTTIRTALGVPSLLHCWLADEYGGGETNVTPDNVTWQVGTVLQTITAKKRYLVITDSTGVAQVKVGYGSVWDWRWGVTRYGRVYYSYALQFE